MARRRRAIVSARLRDAARQHGRIIRLADDNRRAGTSLAQHAGDALKRAAGAEAGDEVVEADIFEVLEYLDCRGFRMKVGIGFVLELAAQKPAMRLRELDGLGEHAAAFLRRRCQHDLRAEEAHHLAALDAEVLGHGHDQGIALLRADHGKTDAGVAAGRFDDGLTRLQLTSPLRVFDDA